MELVDEDRPDPVRDVVLSCGGRGYGHQMYGPVGEQRALRGLIRNNHEAYNVYSSCPNPRWACLMILYANIVGPVLRNGGRFFRFYRRRQGGTFKVGVEKLDMKDPRDRDLIIGRLSWALNPAKYRRAARISYDDNWGEREQIKTEFSIKVFLDHLSLEMSDGTFDLLSEDCPGVSVIELFTKKLTDETKEEEFIPVIKRLSDRSLSLTFSFIRDHLDWFSQ